MDDNVILWFHGFACCLSCWFYQLIIVTLFTTWSLKVSKLFVVSLTHFSGNIFLRKLFLFLRVRRVILFLGFMFTFLGVLFWCIRVTLFGSCGLRVILFYSCGGLTSKFWCFMILFLVFYDFIRGYVFIYLWLDGFIFGCAWFIFGVLWL